MKLIVGLGNPGKEYENTRHNSGYLTIDSLADSLQVEFDREGFSGIYTKFKVDDEDVILLKPTTFMNLSGKSVLEAKQFFKVDLEDILIIYDDMAIKTGDIRLRLKGSSGGQKGIQNIIDLLGTSDIKRIRVGIGEPEHNAIDYVLGKPKGDELIDWKHGIDNASKAAKEFVLGVSFSKIMSKYNGGDNS